jgi:hypothetical protein
MTPTTNTRQAATIDLTGLPEKAVEAVRAIVEMIQQPVTKTPALSPEERLRLFEAYMQEVAKRAGRYPEGFVADDSRESIYQGRGE